MHTKERDTPIQKNISAMDSINIFAVCDGMGGEDAGEKASLTVVSELKKCHDALKMKDLHTDIGFVINQMNLYTEKTNELIYAMSLQERNRMGTTFACLVMAENKAAALHLGDSRIYVYKSGLLKQLTTDHTEAERLVRLGIIPRANARTHKNKNMLSRYFGISPEEGKLEAEASDVPEIEKDDIFLLCSDGLTDMVSDERIMELCGSGYDCTGISSMLLNDALAQGGKDNITVMVIKIDGIG